MRPGLRTHPARVLHVERLGFTVVVVAGLMGNPNIFAGVQFYGGEINPLVGMLITAVLASAGSNALHEIGERLNMPSTTIAASDSNVTVEKDTGGDGSIVASSAGTVSAQSRDKPGFMSVGKP
jgi:hypothetical protein